MLFMQIKRRSDQVLCWCVMDRRSIPAESCNEDASRLPIVIKHVTPRTRNDKVNTGQLEALFNDVIAAWSRLACRAHLALDHA